MDHVTPRFAVSPVTVAVKEAVVPPGTVAGAAEMTTATGREPGIMTVAELVAEAAATADATTWTFRSDAGGLGGAV
jgi:hypothetical protein